jgi:hypothetical protein
VTPGDQGDSLLDDLRDAHRILRAERALHEVRQPVIASVCCPVEHLSLDEVMEFDHAAGRLLPDLKIHPPPCEGHAAR